MAFFLEGSLVGSGSEVLVIERLVEAWVLDRDELPARQ
jgi:hypothetical protein